MIRIFGHAADPATRLENRSGDHAPTRTSTRRSQIAAGWRASRGVLALVSSTSSFLAHVATWEHREYFEVF
jgi:hypothetical protein